MDTKIEVMWKGWAIRVQVCECNCKEGNRCSEEQFINGINDKMITAEIMRVNMQCKIPDTLQVNKCSDGQRKLKHRAQKAILASNEENSLT